MGFLQDLGLDDLLSSVREMTEQFDELKDEIITSILEPSTELKDTIQDSAASLTGGEAVSSVDSSESNN